MTVGNDARGENSITLEGQTYGLRPSFSAIQNIEKKTGRSLFSLAASASILDLQTGDAGLIVGEMMRAWGEGHPDAENAAVARAVKDSRIAELIFEEGFKDAGKIVAALLYAALDGGVTSAGELKPDREPRAATPDAGFQE